ncbi:flavin-dependent dehydrogenase [Spirosoma oryzae]|uniref:Flavin-dependent dehydrogenase n=1 Tax=Spirosoma oryzae TaxID=1469603 RepID=A0A2T0SAD9_9BACT|nr:NAD(P)/FAD-dependent oxidoreductase [Spirosoma oryzae]PRY30386.1 flavin-dependent dehydrogenase [Spirosoma oryzae]
MSGPAAYHDVVVAGAGPAGCAAAIVLKQAGHNVCLVDQASRLVRKVGESVPGAIIRLLNRLGILGIDTLLSPEDHKRCVANASAWGSDQWVYQDALRNPEGGGWHINRARFDAALRQRAILAGIPLYAARVGPLERSPTRDLSQPGYLLHLKGQSGELIPPIQTPWLIDATGRKAQIGRQHRLPRYRLTNQMAAVYWIDSGEPDRDHMTRLKSTVEGWWYTALLPDTSRIISFQGLPATSGKLIRSPAAFVTQFNATAILPNPISLHSVIACTASDAGLIRMPTVAIPGLVCVGDAALSLDPLSAQGIFFALYSGIKGAEAISIGLTDPLLTTSALQAYQHCVDQVFTANQQLRNHFYLNEHRFTAASYWRQQVLSVILA